MGIIVNESDLIFADTEYYTIIDKEKLLVTLSPDVRIDEIPEMEIFELNSEEKTIIKNKLLPEKDGYIMGVYPGIVFYRCGEEFGKVYFENSDLIPTEISIYKDFIGGIEMINLNEKY